MNEVIRDIHSKTCRGVYSDLNTGLAIEYNEILEKDLGGFNFMIYYNKALLTYEKNINRADLTKILFLASFMDYSNTLVTNFGQGTKNIPMTKRDIIYQLGLNERVARNFLNEMIDKDIIIENNKVYEINTNFVFKGRLEDKHNKLYAKIYTNTIQELYRGTNKRMLDKLGFILELVAFIQKDTNRVVNPLESDKPITCKTYYVSTLDLYAMYLDRDSSNLEAVDKAQLSRFKQSLLKLKFNAFDREYSAFMYVKKTVQTTTHEYWVVNPHLINKLNDYSKHIDIIKNDFDIVDLNK